MTQEQMNHLKAMLKNTIDMIEREQPGATQEKLGEIKGKIESSLSDMKQYLRRVS